MIEFSTNKPEADKSYMKRVGAYAIIEDEKKLIAIVKTNTGYFLPGGGLEDGESLEECLKRECLEEIGAKIFNLNNFAKGSCFFYSTTVNKYMEGFGYFFTGNIEKEFEAKTEPDHELIWLSTSEALRLLYLDNQREALRIHSSLCSEPCFLA